MIHNKKNNKILARFMEPGDLVFSPRTQQMMLVLSTAPMDTNDTDGARERLKIAWLPLVFNSRINCVDIDPDLIFLKA